MKKLISLLLALVMVCSLATVAFAVDLEDPEEDPVTPEYTDMGTITIDKTYTVTNPGTSYPDETFTFTFDDDWSVTEGGVGSDEQGVPSIGSVDFYTADGTSTKQVTITLPDYTAVGIYTYTITEDVGDTAGVVYYSDEITLVVTVIQEENGKIRVAAIHTVGEGETKSDDIENVYNAGSLSVQKLVTGELADREEYFPVVITLTGDTDKDYSGNVITISGGSYTNNPTSVYVNSPATFYLKHNETVTLGNIPYGVTYTVEESTPSDYQVAYNNDADNDDNTETDLVIDDAADKVVITNTKGGTPDTGITLDTLPFVLILAVCAGAVVLFVVKRRRSTEF